MISKVPLCQEPQAAAGTCSAESQIGHTVVGAGAGPAPFYVPQAGQPPAPIYLTGPYKGAPFGLSIVVPVIAGPFNLGTVVVRAAINVDPVTAQVDDHDRPVAADPGRYPDGSAADRYGDRPSWVHVQPDELRPDGLLGCRAERRRRDRADLKSFPGRVVSGAEVQTGLQSLDVGQDVAGERGEPRREDRVPDGCRWVRTRRARSRTSRLSRSNSPSSCRRG